MYKIEITYKNFLDTEVTEEFQFNLMDSELLELEAKTHGGLRKLITDLSNETADKNEVVEFISTFLKASYGVMSGDGRRFDKSEEVWENFHRTKAYDILFMQLITDEKMAVAFISEVLSKEETE